MLVNAHEASPRGPLDGSPSAHITSRSFPRAEDRTQCYLLFAGLYQTPLGGLGDLVGTFTSEKTAREAFQQIRLNGTSHTSWAQLAVVDAHGIKPLCWFGIGAKPAGKSLAFPQARKVTPRKTEGGAMEVETPESSSAREPATTAGPRFPRISRRGLSKKITPALMGRSRRRQDLRRRQETGPSSQASGRGSRVLLGRSRSTFPRLLTAQTGLGVEEDNGYLFAR